MPLVMSRPPSALDGHRESFGFMVAKSLPKASRARCIALNPG